MIRKIFNLIYNFFVCLFGWEQHEMPSEEDKPSYNPEFHYIKELITFENESGPVGHEIVEEYHGKKDQILLETEHIQKEATIDEDERQNVKNTHILPYSRVVNILRVGYNDATGEFVSPRTILTAAHVVYDRDTKKTFNLEIVSGRNSGEKYDESQKLKIRKIYIPKQYIDGSAATKTDFAIIELEQDYLEYGYFKLLSTLNNSFFKDKKIFAIGYPGDKRQFEMWQSAGHVIISDYDIHHDADTVGGNSGGPIISEDKEILYAVHNGFIPVDNLNVGAKINPDVYMWLKKRNLIK